MAVLIGYTSYNRLPYTQRTLPALLDWCGEYGRGDVSVVVVDDASTDGSREYLADLWANRGRHAAYWRGVALGKERRGHAACSNFAWRQEEDWDYVKFDNDVLILRTDWLETLRLYALRLPLAGIVAHNCEIVLHGEYAEKEYSPGIHAAARHHVAGACAFIPRTTRLRCGRWNENEPGQQFNRGLDRVYAEKIRLAGLKEYYTTGRKNVYVKCLISGETGEYAQERARMKRAAGWTQPVMIAYRRGRRPLNDVP